MGNINPTVVCPKHKNKHIIFICSEKRCIEPLCENCLQLHRQQHMKLGFSPNFIPLSNIADQHKDFQKLNQQNIKKQHKIPVKDGQFVPTVYFLKKLTRQYFIHRAKNNTSNVLSTQYRQNQNEIKRSGRSKSHQVVSSQTVYQYDGKSEVQNKQKLKQIISEYETYRKMQNNSRIKAKVIQFFKKNLVLNEGLIGQQFSHLYK